MSPKSVIMLLLLAGAFGFFAYNILILFRLVTLGKRPDDRFDDIPGRMRKVLVYVFGQKRLFKYRFAGIEHAMIFWGFLVITVGTVEMLASGVFPGFKLLPGAAHGIYELVLDVVQALVLVAIGMGIINRLTIGRRREVNGPDAVVILGLIFGLMITAFLTTGARIALAEASPGMLPVSWAFSSLYDGMSWDGTVFWKEFFWWFHVLIVLSFLNYLPYSKHSHVLTAVLNVFFQSLKPRGQLSKIDFEDIPEDLDHFGSSKVADFSWKDILDSYTCTECGRCTDNCPAWNTEKVLSPRDVVVKLRHYVSSEGKDILAGKPAEEQPDLPDAQWVTPEELWACTTCNACVEQCPLFIDQMGKIMDMRRFLTLEGKLSGTATRTLQKLQNNGNPWGFPENQRGGWLSEMDVPVLGVSTEDASGFDVIYWAGCFGGYDPRGQEVSKAIVSLLKIAGVNFAVMGSAETCTGDPARRLGEEALYQMLAAQNIETLNEMKVKKILANCPHCFNTIKNEYPQFGGSYEVVHHTDFLLDLIREGKLNPDSRIEKKMTYHDSCYIGRYNNVYDSPREILKSIPGIDLVEMKRNRTKSFCCGAGGGKIWMEEEAPRVNWNRFDEAAGTEPDTLATACYFCNTMFDDAARFRGKEEEIEVKDIAEILTRSVSPADDSREAAPN